MCLIVFPSWGQEGWTVYILAFLNHQLRTETWSGKWSEVAQLCPTLCDPMDDRSPGSSVHGILQAQILACISSGSSPGDLPDSGIKPGSPAFQADFFTHLSHHGKPWPGFSPSYGLRAECKSGNGMINSLEPPHEVHVSRAALPLEKAQAKRCRG